MPVPLPFFFRLVKKCLNCISNTVMTMKLSKISLLLLVFYCLFSSFKPFPGGPGDYAAIIKKQAGEMNNALIKKDYKTYMKYMHPKVIEHMGGEQGVLDTMKQVDAQMAVYGMKIGLISLNEPSAVIDTANELQATITANADMTVKGGVVHTNSVFIAISKNKGLHWFFIDVTADYDVIRSQMKDLSSKLVIPIPEKPTFDEMGD